MEGRKPLDVNKKVQEQLAAHIDDPMPPGAVAVPEEWDDVRLADDDRTDLEGPEEDESGEAPGSGANV
jgi:hypothetical protein